MIDTIAAILVLVGGFFSLVAGIGLYRLPDLYLRMHAATKAGTLGGGIILIAVAFHSQETEVIARAAVGVIFLLITAPIGAHLLGRAGYLSGVKMWSKSGEDALAGRYNPKSDVLDGTPRK